MDCENPAGFFVRFGASLIDGILLSITIGFLTLMVYGEFFMNPSPFNFVSLLYSLILPVVWYGYTIGKRALGIRIASVDGEKVGIGTMLLRDVVAGFVYVLTFGIGLLASCLMIAVREDSRSIHDFIAGTYVTYNPPEHEDPYHRSQW